MQVGALLPVDSPGRKALVWPSLLLPEKTAAVKKRMQRKRSIMDLNDTDADADAFVSFQPRRLLQYFCVALLSFSLFQFPVNLRASKLGDAAPVSL